MKYIIGMDIGTTAAKGVLYDLNGQMIISASRGYPLIQRKLGQAEEDPQVILDAVQKIIFKLAEKVQGEVAAISWSSQMHSLIGLGKNYEILTNSITWADNRCTNIVEEVKKNGLAQKIYHTTGMPIHPMAPIYKLMWLKQSNPNLFHQVQKWIGIKEYIIFRLTGKIMIDTTMAAGTGMLNLKTLSWDQDLLQKAGIAADQLPDLASPTEIVGSVSTEYVQKLGISADTKIVLGASDGYLSTIGVDAVDENHFALNVGTSGAIRTISPQAQVDQDARYFCYSASKRQFLLGGPVNNGGIVLDWARRTLTLLNEKATVKDFLRLAKSAQVGSNGLIFLPYLGGERAPIWDANARGSFVGLTRQHTKADMARAVIEGIIFNLYDAATGLIESTKKPAAINATGGFMQSDLIRQTCADIFDVPIVTMKEQQSGSLAAMFLARQALGLNKNVDEIGRFVEKGKVYYPNQKEAAIYQKLFPLYREIKNDLAASYQKFRDINTI